jgi:hypothetical protein
MAPMRTGHDNDRVSNERLNAPRLRGQARNLVLTRDEDGLLVLRFHTRRRPGRVSPARPTKTSQRRLRRSRSTAGTRRGRSPAPATRSSARSTAHAPVRSSPAFFVVGLEARREFDPGEPRRPPRGVIDDPATSQWTSDQRDPAPGSARSNGATSLRRRERGHDDRERARCYQCSRCSLQRAGRYQQADRGRERARKREGAEGSDSRS